MHRVLGKEGKNTSWDIFPSRNFSTPHVAFVCLCLCVCVCISRRTIPTNRSKIWVSGYTIRVFYLEIWDFILKLLCRVEKWPVAVINYGWFCRNCTVCEYFPKNSSNIKLKYRALRYYIARDIRLKYMYFVICRILFWKNCNFYIIENEVEWKNEFLWRLI